MNNLFMRFALLLLLVSTAAAADLYRNDFEKAALQALPEDMMLMEGGFAVAREGANKFLELPGAPLETFGVLFGPVETNGLSVSARVFGTAKGRRLPAFALGLNGVGGYKLQMAPAKKMVELYRGDELLASASAPWESGTWTLLRLQTRHTRDGLSVQGKTWKHGAPEPGEWTISHLDTSEPPPGRASLWGAPYSGTPIRFDDLSVTSAR